MIGVGRRSVISQPAPVSRIQMPMFTERPPIQSAAKTRRSGADDRDGGGIGLDRGSGVHAGHCCSLCGAENRFGA
jgi:hypothetical protein